MDITLVNYMQEQLRLVTSDFKRYMYDKLPWEARLVGLMGPRGVGKYTFEVGGRKKGCKQVKDVQNAYIVRDDTEYAAGEFLPLWSFGLMY